MSATDSDGSGRRETPISHVRSELCKPDLKYQSRPPRTVTALVSVTWAGGGRLDQVIVDDPAAVSLRVQVERLWWLLPSEAKRHATWTARPGGFDHG